jgi:hypothetical protein
LTGGIGGDAGHGQDGIGDPGSAGITYPSSDLAQSLTHYRQGKQERHGYKQLGSHAKITSSWSYR